MDADRPVRRPGHPRAASRSATCCCPAAARSWSPPATCATRPTGPVRRLVVALRGTEARRRTERSHAELIATVAHELRSPLTSRQGLHRDPAGQVGAVHRRPEEADAGDRRRRRQPGHPADRRTARHLPHRLRPAGGPPPAGGHRRRRPPPRRRRTSRPAPPPDRFRDPDRRADCPRCGPTPTRSTRCWATCWKTRCATAREPSPSRWRPRSCPAPMASPTTEGTAVTVSDEGPGIPEESIGRVFTRFWRGSKRGGTGLGLYIVKGIVEAHGGTITVGRAPGGGARVPIHPARRDAGLPGLSPGGPRPQVIGRPQRRPPVIGASGTSVVTTRLGHWRPSASTKGRAPANRKYGKRCRHPISRTTLSRSRH